MDAVLPRQRRELETLGRERRPHPKGRRLTLATRAFRGRHRSNPGCGRQLAGAREPPIRFLDAQPGFNSSDHALAFQPLNAGFKSLKIIVVGSPAGTTFRGCLLVLAIGRLGGSKMTSIEI
jgi:hypothetical protein